MKSKQWVFALVPVKSEPKENFTCLNINPCYMATKLAFTLSLFILYSCGLKTGNKTVNLLQGTYKGQFIRSSPLARYAPSNVTLTFTGNKFYGESDKTNYPAICSGTFKLTGNEIVFTNECIWTADFDWTYILKDKFTIHIDGDKLEMTKSIGDNTDHYALTLQ